MSDQLTVRGFGATKPEYLISAALDKLGYDYEFQVWIWGGQSVRGGVVVDWVVYMPRPQPIEYDGTHWHTGAASIEDQLQRARIADYYNVAEVIVITGDELDSDSTLGEAIALVKARLGGML